MTAIKRVRAGEVRVGDWVKDGAGQYQEVVLVTPFLTGGGVYLWSDTEVLHAKTNTSIVEVQEKEVSQMTEVKTDFKRGDRVKTKPGARSNINEDVENRIGEVEFVLKTNPLAWVDFDGLPGQGQYVATSDLELVVTDPEEDKINQALAQTKEDLYLCGEFDVQVERAKNLSLVDRLEHVARDGGHDRVFDHFKKVLDDLGKPKLPEIGRWIKAITKDSKTHVFKVTAHKFGGYRGSTFLQEGKHNWDDFFICRAKPSGGTDTQRCITKWEYTEAPLPDLKKGDWVSFKEFGRAFEREFVRYEEGYFFHRHRDNGSVVGLSLDNVTEIKKIDRPASAWKVGDTVPAYTTVGPEWVGRSDDLYANRTLVIRKEDYSGYDRKILWIDTTEGSKA